MAREEHVAALFDAAANKCGTDGLLGGKPHPRVFGSFPASLGSMFARQKMHSTLEAAIRKMTSKPAEVFGFEKRAC